MRNLIVMVCALLWAGIAWGQDLHLLSLNEFTLETAKIVNFDDPYFSQFQDPAAATDEHWTQFTAAHFNLDLVEYDHWGLYWNNEIEGASTDRRFRETAWTWEGGLNLDDYFQVYWDHRSVHLLDATNAGHFPLTNMYGIRAIIYKRGD